MILQGLMAGEKIDMSRIFKGDESSSDIKTIKILGGHEYIIYPLIGSALIELPGTGHSAWIGGRNHITEPPLPALYIRMANEHSLVFTSQSDAVDMVIVNTKYGRKAQNLSEESFHVLQCKIRDVGKGHYRRQVSDQIMPDNTSLHIGETISMNDNQSGGCWSSWPQHASLAEASKRFMEHEEMFYVITPTVGVMHREGVYQNGGSVNDVIMIENNNSYIVPLGLHSVCFEPRSGECWGWYLWAYDSYLKKTYNTQAHHVGTYVR